MATREFDTDFSEGKDGAERIETYHYDTYGRVVRTDSDFTGDALPINAYSTREYDEYGRSTIRRDHDSAERLISKTVFEYDAYNQIIKNTRYTNEENIDISTIYKRDEYGREVVNGRDRNLDGELNSGDTWRTTVYNDAGRVYKAIDTLANGSETSALWFYDEFGRRSYTFVDSNGNELWDNGETKHLDTYHGTNARDEVHRFVAPDGENPTYIMKFVYINAGDQGTQIGTLDAPQGKEFKSFNYNVYGSVVSSNEDYTTENWHRFFDKVGDKIEVINMADARASTVITLDNDVLSKITGS
ncbi:hypothetical protein ACERCE_12440, partial [Mannheimia sp. E15BD]|uniref:hypothetical protein n=1 Tax=Mannheimia sp. E15BD TaxID=3278706 RepID=UPI00359D12CA